jgi:hypothetical protein
MRWWLLEQLHDCPDRHQREEKDDDQADAANHHAGGAVHRAKEQPLVLSMHRVSHTRPFNAGVLGKLFGDERGLTVGALAAAADPPTAQS